MLSTLLTAAVLLSPQGTAPPPSQPNLLTRRFGTEGEPGSFEIVFDRRGAGIWSVRLLDHYVSRAAARKPEKGTDDYQLLVADVQQGNLALRLQEDKDSHLFPMRLNGLPAAGDADGTPWRVEDLPDGGIRFSIDSGPDGLELYKIYRPSPKYRGISLEIGLVARSGSAAVGTMGIELDGPMLINPKEVSLFGNPAVAIAVVEGAPSLVRHPGTPGTQVVPWPEGRWSMAGTTNRFFGAFLFPLDDAAATAVTGMKVISVPDADDARTKTPHDAAPQPVYQLKLRIPAAGEQTAVRLGLYLGPKSFRVFDEQPEHARFLPIMDIDLEPPCCFGMVVPGARQIATLLLKLLGLFQSLVVNWGVAIMMLTVLVRGLLAPLNFRMQKSMRAYGARMAVAKPKLDKLKQQYADDPKAYQAAMLQFQREHKLMPPIGGCLPIFLTMPIYLGLFAALRVAYDLRQKPFVAWIDDLSQPDALFPLGFGTLVPYFNLLPLLWIVMLVILQLRTPLPTDPQQRQMQAIMRYMPIVFGVLLYNYASGLMVYMITSMVWTMFESSVIKKVLGPIDPNVQAMAPTPVM